MNFYHKPPTQPGIYWFRLNADSIPRVIEVTDLHGDGVLGTFHDGREQTVSLLGGYFSDRLVPSEVNTPRVQITDKEKREMCEQVFAEGFGLGDVRDYDDWKEAWAVSDAKRTLDHDDKNDPEEKCVWRSDRTRQFRTACGLYLDFAYGGPITNRFTFCPKCGKPLVEERKSNE